MTFLETYKIFLGSDYVSLVYFKLKVGKFQDINQMPFVGMKWQWWLRKIQPLHFLDPWNCFIIRVFKRTIILYCFPFLQLYELDLHSHFKVCCQDHAKP